MRAVQLVKNVSRFSQNTKAHYHVYSSSSLKSILTTWKTVCKLGDDIKTSHKSLRLGLVS